MAEPKLKELKTMTVFLWEGAVHTIPVTKAVELPAGADVKDLTDRFEADAVRNVYKQGSRWASEGPLEEGQIYELRKIVPYRRD